MSGNGLCTSRSSHRKQSPYVHEWRSLCTKSSSWGACPKGPSQMGKLRHGDLKQLASSYTASKWQSQAPSPGRLGLVAVAGRVPVSVSCGEVCSPGCPPALGGGGRRQGAAPWHGQVAPSLGAPHRAGCYSPKVAHVSRVSRCSQAECGPSAHSFRCLADVGIGLPWRQPGLSPLHGVIIDL